MQDFIWFLVTVAVGVIGGYAAVKLKIPVGAIIGAMVAVILLNVISGDKAVFYPQVKMIIQLTVGTLSGSKVGRAEFTQLRKIILPALIIYPAMLVVNLIFGTVIYKASALDVFTSFYCISPGSISDIAIISVELGADEAAVGLIHAVRVLVCSILLPPLFVAALKRRQRRGVGEISVDSETAAEEQVKKSPAATLALFAVSICGGLLFNSLGITGGAIIGSMLFSMAFTCLFGKCHIPKTLKKLQQMSTGIHVGAGVTVATVLSVKDLLVPIAILTVSIVVGTFATAYLVMKTKKLDYISALACCAPGGMTEILLITDELGGDTAKVGVIHAFRIFLVVALFPPVINWFITLIT